MESRTGWAGLGAENPMRYEQQLERAAASIGPLRWALAAIAERLLSRKAHERLGYARLSDYARERPGISARQLQELARVHRALRELPQLEAALLANALPWSKVRLVARVATAADEGGWIARAGRSTVRALEREVRERGPSSEPVRAEPMAKIALWCAPSVRGRWDEVRELAEQVAGERLSEGEALEAVLAEASAALSIESTTEAEPTASCLDPGPASSAASRSERASARERLDELAEGLARELAEGRAQERADDLEQELTRELTERLEPQRAGRLTQEPLETLTHEPTEGLAQQRGDALADALRPEVLRAGALRKEARTEPGKEPRREPGKEREERSAIAIPAEEPADAPRTRELELPWLQQLTEGLNDADAFALDRRLLRAVRLEQSLDAVLAPLLRRAAAPEHEWDHGVRPIAEYGREVLGLSATKTRTLVRLDRAASFIPALRDAHERGALSWAKAQCLLPLLLMDVDAGEGCWRTNWVAWAERVTVRRLEQDVRRMRLLRGQGGAAFRSCLERPERTAQLSTQQTTQQPMCAHPQEPATGLEASECLGWRVPRDVAWLYADVMATLRVRLARAAAPPVTEADLFDGILRHAHGTWSRLDPKARRPDPVIDRDAYRCTVPGCTSRKNLHDHHIVFRSAGGSNEEENRTTLCAFHHQRGVHGGWLRVTGHAPDRLVFELGVRESGPPIARYTSGDVRAA